MKQLLTYKHYLHVEDFHGRGHFDTAPQQALGLFYIHRFCKKKIVFLVLIEPIVKET